MSLLCDCSCTWGDDASLYHSAVVKARIPHTCCECKEQILYGQKYEKVRGLWNGVWATYHTCLTCKAIREDFCPGGWVFGELGETIKECLGVEL